MVTNHEDFIQDVGKSMKELWDRAVEVDDLDERYQQVLANEQREVARKQNATLQAAAHASSQESSDEFTEVF